MSTNTLISIIGPTAIGKTSLSIKLANFFNAEIISADSRQFYKEMSIGTAVPTPKELGLAKHNFIHHKSVQDNYNVGDFEKEAIHLLDKLFKKHKYVILVGGSGLYVDAITNGLDHFPVIDPEIRIQLNERHLNNGLESLQTQLKKLDEISFNTIDIDNPHRVIRALEICIGAKKPYSSFLNKDKGLRNFKTITIGLNAPREIIYQRINNRVDLMMKEGLLNEVKNLAAYRNLNSLNTVGYKELFNYLDGKNNLDAAIVEIKKNTRRFAKRQLTWFRKNNNILWFDYQVDIKDVIKQLNENL